MTPGPARSTRPARWAARAAAVAPEATVAAYQRDGAVVLRGLLDAAELALLTRGIDHNLAHPSPRAIVASRPDDPGRFVEDFCCWTDNADYRTVMVDSPLPEAAARLMRSASVRLYHDHMLTKEPGTRAPTPWHQDQPYYNSYLGDDIRHAPRRWKTSPEFPGLADDLPAGAPMAHALFPLLIGAYA